MVNNKPGLLNLKGETMKLGSKIIFSLVFFFGAGAYALEETNAPRTVKLATNISSAFTSDFPVGTERTLLPHLQCIFNQMQRDYSVQVIPWRRAYQDVKSNRIDGFFTAIPMRHINPYAVLSAPMVLENWYWFWRADTVAPETWRGNHKLGSILGSQQETWLGEAGYKVEMSANNLPQLIKLLRSKRIDVILADRENFLHAAEELNIDPNQFQSRFFRYVPLGVYFNAEYLKQNPDFLPQFNQQITGCATDKFAVTDYEQQLINKLLGEKIEQWKRLPIVQLTLEKHNAKSNSLSTEEILARDKKWAEAFLRGDASYSLELVH
jgi:ABC-type amino acid transport substrate-binding protein